MASLLANIAPAYNPDESYSFGAKTLNNDRLYQCNKSTTGPFDPDAWTEIYLSELIQGGVSLDGLEPELLWENTTSLSNFPAQSITVDVSKFKAVFVEFKCYSGTASYLYVDLSKTNQPVMGYNPNNPKTRGLTINGNTFTFTAAVFNGSAVNNDLIPIRVYGIKDVVVDVTSKFKEVTFKITNTGANQVIDLKQYGITKLQSVLYGVDNTDNNMYGYASLINGQKYITRGVSNPQGITDITDTTITFNWTSSTVEWLFRVIGE